MLESNIKKPQNLKTGKVNLFYFPKKYSKSILLAVKEALGEENKKDIREINLILVGNPKIKMLNRRFRNVNRITDVISFNYSLKPLEGDIYISKERSFDQAKREGHSWGNELVYLALHGVLHLLGYSDYTKPNRKKMFKVQDKIYNRIISKL